jgi:hypothetical protein
MQVSKFLNVPVEQLLEFEGQAVSPSDNPKLPLLVTGMN